MSRTGRFCRRLAPLTAAIVLLPAWLPSASPAEITAFVSGGSPSATWAGGWGGTLTITLLNLVGGELEIARQPGQAADQSLLTGSAKAYLEPSIGRIVPYAGLGAGLYHTALPGDDDQGTFGSLFLGLKLKVPLGVLVRAEYQWLHMPPSAPLRLEGRFFVGAGISF